jgi:hypothetical protein
LVLRRRTRDGRAAGRRAGCEYAAKLAFLVCTYGYSARFRTLRFRAGSCGFEQFRFYGAIVILAAAAAARSMDRSDAGSINATDSARVRISANRGIRYSWHTRHRTS